jgi:hypothetical protein
VPFLNPPSCLSGNCEAGVHQLNRWKRIHQISVIVPSFASRYVNPVAQHIVMSQPNNQSALNRFLRCLMAPSDLRQLMELCRKHNRKVLRPLQPVSSNSNSSPNKSDVLSSIDWRPFSNCTCRQLFGWDEHERRDRRGVHHFRFYDI